MFKFCLHQTQPQHPWQWTVDCWSDGISTIQPFPHPMLEHISMTDGQSTFFVVRERIDAGSPLDARQTSKIADTRTYQQSLAEIRASALDFTLIECNPDLPFRITVGLWGTAPLYLTDAGGRLHGSWSLPDLREHFNLDALEERVVTRILTVRHRYARETLFSGVYQLTERAYATFDEVGLAIHYPEPARHARPRELREGVDAAEIYRQTLSDAVHERRFNPKETAVELSGGIDSANIAATLAEEHHGQVLSYALLIGGEAGEQQVRRRAEMLTRFGFPDLTVDALPLAPLNPTGQRARGELIDPMGEPYHEAVGKILARARQQGVRTVFTGDGGDELLSLRGDEWAEVGRVPGRYADNVELPAWLGPRALDVIDSIEENVAPPSTINHSTLRGFALRSPQFLDAGLWPVSPFCSPRLIRFAEQLPVRWRHDKYVARERLARLSFSPEVVRPPKRENFRHVMEHGLRHYGMPLLETLLPDSITVDLGFVDGDALRREHQRVNDGGPIATMLFAVISLELALRALTTSRDYGKDSLCM
ncbi:asparagine synthase-related protein [Actinokineospora iranica]|uniref:asparagine synthase (glutamine-hydrolyzing) n=1 Tax=Actinokineospora iranica TaxID=1271860 RepID=A0A1G6P9M0_9PSEU|nr:asparagine synthase C-terminal domain-containing protein [Actinokineospora iranica]SDC76823.1 asparagine synthase (glutamine-hydrolysing) [Actinokineospora iranica]